MKRVLTVISILLLCSTSGLSQIGGQPGAYSRMGFGARGIAMGNAMIAVIAGDAEPYYNPAVVAWTTNREASASAGLLSLDRSLNFLNYTQPLPPKAALSVGIINAGVSNIDGRDADAVQTGALRTSENQVRLTFATRLGKIGIGVNIKLLYYHLYTDMTSTTAGVDLGVLYPVNQSLTVAFSIRDINSKYKWDSGKVYGTDGASTTDKFPQLSVLGAAYVLPDSIALVSADIVFSNAGTTTLQAGAEVPLTPNIALRAGVDRIDLKDKGMGILPAAGFTLRTDLEGWSPTLSYAFAFEPFAPSGLHMISLGVSF
jgi:hypothetical protein